MISRDDLLNGRDTMPGTLQNLTPQYQHIHQMSLKRRITSHFTLIEILFAMIILALSLGVTLAISAQAKGEIIRAQQRWIMQHSLEQVVEYCLLADPEHIKVPDDLLPVGFSAECQVDIVEEGLPEFALVEDYKGWQLGVYTITVYNRSGDLSSEQIVHKLIPQDRGF